MRKIMLGAITALLMLTGLFTSPAHAAKDDEKAGPNNEKGLCTAYFNGQKNGHDEDNNPGPFAGLEEDGAAYDEENGADDGDPDTDDDGEDLAEEQGVVSDVFEYCEQFGIMGNPEENGRYDCRDGEDRDSPARDTDGEDGDDEGTAPDGDGEVECFINGTEDSEEPVPAP